MSVFLCVLELAKGSAQLKVSFLMSESKVLSLFLVGLISSSATSFLVPTLQVHLFCPNFKLFKFFAPDSYYKPT
jgi:hypothetical protein